MAELFTPITEQNTGMDGAYQKGNTCAIHAMLNAQIMMNIKHIVSEMQLSKDDLLMNGDFLESENFVEKASDLGYLLFLRNFAGFTHGVFDDLVEKFYPEIMEKGMNMWQLKNMCRDQMLRVLLYRIEKIEIEKIERENEELSWTVDAEWHLESVLEVAEWFGDDEPHIAQLTEKNEKRLIEYLKENQVSSHGMILCLETGTKLKHFVAVFSIEEDGFLVIDSNVGFALKFVPFSRVHEIVILKSFLTNASLDLVCRR